MVWPCAATQPGEPAISSHPRLAIGGGEGGQKHLATAYHVAVRAMGHGAAGHGGIGGAASQPPSQPLAKPWLA